MYIFEITADSINRLNDVQLTSLLDRLLVLEAQIAEVPVDSIELGLNIKAPDGGIDASIRWKNGVERTDFLPSRFSVFQCKAEDMAPGKCATELTAADGKLKPLVGEAWDGGATYILFTTQKLNTAMKRKRLDAMRKKLVDLKYPLAQTALFVIYSAEDIARWVNRYLSAVAYVRGATGFSIVPGLKVWSEWKDSESGTWPYRSTNIAATLTLEIRDALSKPRQSIRLNGLPGLGKTRLVLEALAPEDERTDLGTQTIYYNAGHASSDLPQHVIEWVRHSLSGILVVDNCMPETHTMLEKEVMRPDSKLSLITISSNPAEDMSVAARLVLTPCTQPEVQEAANDYLAGLPESDAGKIAHLAGGFLFFAYLLCDAYKNRKGIDQVLVDSKELLRFLGSAVGASNEDAIRTIEACSIFESIDYDDGTGDEAASVLSISEVSESQFHRHVRHFIRHGVIEQTGRFIRVRPHPLALRLCRNWWEGVTPKRALAVFNAIPASLVNALCERLRMLDTLPEARDIAAKLCGPCHPFGQAEVLFSERGARIFRALAEVSPEHACSSLQQVVNDAEQEQLRGAKGSRREWVWALNKLIFRKATYSCAADTLLKLALAENESYSNNATGTLLETFQVILPGTEVSLAVRAEKLLEFLESDDPSIISLALQAAGRALRGEYLSRMVGAEDQGSGPALMDYEPKSREEISEYWVGIVNLIKGAVDSGRCDTDDALAVFAQHLRGFIRADEDSLAELVVRIAVEWSRRPWEAGIEALRDALRFDIEGEPRREAAVKIWIAKLSPKDDDVAGQLALYVSRPSWSDISNNRFKLKVRELAEQCAATFSTSKSHIRALFFGEQRAGFAFGNELVRRMKSSQKFLEFSVGILKERHLVPINLSVLCGFASGASGASDVDSDSINSLVESVLTDEDLQQYAPDILSSCKPRLKTLLRLVQLVREKKLEARALQRFSYGQALNHLTPTETSQLITELSAVGPDAAWVALEIGYMQFHGRIKEMWPGLSVAIKTLLTSGVLALTNGNVGRAHDMHAWEECVLKVLVEGDEAFVENVTCQLVTLASDKISSRDFPDKVASMLLQAHARTAWPIFSEALLGTNVRLSYNLERLLGRGLRGDATEPDFPLAQVDQDVFEQWLRKTSDAPVKAARMLRLVEKNGDALEWSKSARLLINEYGSTIAVLNAITANLHTGVSWGPRSPFWRDIISLLDGLSSHPQKTVRTWAKSFEQSLLKDIATEQDAEDARSVGRW